MDKLMDLVNYFKTIDLKKYTPVRKGYTLIF